MVHPMIEHALVLALTVALLAVLQSRAHWHFHYKVRTEVRHEVLKPTAERTSRRVVSSRPPKSTAERIGDRQEELVTSALVNLGASRKDALKAAKAAMEGCETKDFDSLFRFALQLVTAQAA